MAQRRMFSPSIVCSDIFLDMPSSGRDLYYQLGMYADDDGFVNPRKIMRMLGSSEDDLKILIAKKFVIPFPSGVLVIKDWKINNLVRKDWYKPTLYLEERETLKTDESGAYIAEPILVNDSLTVRTRRLDQVREDLSSADAESELSLEVDEELLPTKGFGKKREPSVEKTVLRVFALFDDPARGMWLKIPAQRNAAKELIAKYGYDKVSDLKQYADETKDEPFAPQIRSPYDLITKLSQLKAFREKHG